MIKMIKITIIIERNIVTNSNKKIIKKWKSRGSSYHENSRKAIQSTMRYWIKNLNCQLKIATDSKNKKIIKKMTSNINNKFTKIRSKVLLITKYNKQKVAMKMIVK